MKQMEKRFIQHLSLEWLGLVEDLDHITTQHLNHAGDLIYLLGETKPEFGGSELQKLMEGKIFGKAPEIDLEVEKKHQKAVLEAIRAGLVAVSP